jgi:hypothetical protein
MKRKKVINSLVITIITIISSLGTLELAYRFQWFDFYKVELNGLNSKGILGSKSKRILVIGDSFTAATDSYVKVLRDSLSDYSVINAAVPGTGILQHAIYAPHRIKQFSPDIFIYQMYVGNDLFDISHPYQSSNISLLRRAYWLISDQLLSISFVNFRFAGIRYKFYDDAGGRFKPKEMDSFSVETYSKRERLNYRAEPKLIENTLYLKNGRNKDWLIFINKFKRISSDLPSSTKKYFIIIPHQTQLSEKYIKNHMQLGAQFNQETPISSDLNYPLYKAIIELCELTGTELIDPLNMLREMDQMKPVYYSNDPHLNTHGQQLLGEFVSKKMLH